MRAQNIKNVALGCLGLVAVLALGACTQAPDEDSVTVEGGVSIAYVKRPTSSLGNPTDSIMTGEGGDLYIRDRSSPSGAETNVTSAFTQGTGDVSDPEVSYDGNKILFAMSCASGNGATVGGQPACTNRYQIWEYDIPSTQFRRIVCDAAFPGDDVDPAYLPDGRIVFVSNRQEGSKTLMQAQGITPYTYVDEYEREPVTALHVMDNNGANCKQISFNQSHDRNPTVLQSGEIMFSRWDHVGDRNQFTVFTVNADGTNLFVRYGAHSPGNSYLHPREMPDGRIVSTAMPLSGTREGGSIEIIDATHYADNDAPAPGAPPVPNQLGEIAGQFQITKLFFPSRSNADQEAMRGMDISPLGRYSTPYPLWDGTGRLLVAYTPSQPTNTMNALGEPTVEEGTPKYGIYMLDPSTKTLRPVVPPQNGFYYSDPVALQARSVPASSVIPPRDPSIGAGLGVFDVNTVYDTDRLQRMGDAVMASGESIPRNSINKPDLANIKKPGTTPFNNRVARFFRISRSIPTPAGLDRETIGETEFEMQQIVGYGVIEPDGSIRTKVPADTPITITALDSQGRAFTPHTHWIQAREGERRLCKGCHSARIGTTTEGGFLNNPVDPDPGVPDATKIGSHPDPADPMVKVSTATMAEIRASRDANYSNLKRDPLFNDFWTTLFNANPDYGTSATPQTAIALNYGAGATPTIKGPSSCNTTWSKECTIVINFSEHIQPILTAKCASCHTGAGAAAGIDLSATIAGAFGRETAYQELLVGDPLLDDNGLPIVTIDDDGEIMIQREMPPVEPGFARGSRLIERISEARLKANDVGSTEREFCRAGGTNCLGAATWSNHGSILNASERRIISEWVDLGAQYFNDPFDSSGNIRSAAASLDENAFRCNIQPVLMTSCATCHAPFSGNGSPANPVNAGFAASRFVLTSDVEGNFSVTASMVTDLAVPSNSLLLTRPARSISDTPPHPGVTPVLPVGSANYNTIQSWIAGTLTATCP